MYNPQEISLAEWRELIAVPDVRDIWGLSDETAEDFADEVYGVKFDYMTDSPGYVGDLFILHGGGFAPPVVLIRVNGALQLT